MTPEDAAKLTKAEIEALDARQIRELTVAHYEAMSAKQIMWMYPPTKIGPTWNEPEPEYTLGDEIIDWCTMYLDNSDGSPWEFSYEQVGHLKHWYAVNENGDFINRKGALIRLKGWGKDPYLAALCLIELCGPSRFSHWDTDGKPVGKPHLDAWVRVAAVSREQTKNTMTLFPSLISPELKRDYQVDAGVELIRARGGRVRLEAVTSNYKSLEGGRATFTVLNEVQYWTQGNGGVAMFNTAKGDAAKTSSRWIAIGNAHVPGEDSVGEALRYEYERVRDGLAPHTGLMYDTLEAHSATPLSKPVLRAVLEKIKGGSEWLKTPGLIDEAMSTSTPVSEARRKYLNQVVTSDDALYGPEQWDALENRDAYLDAGEEIVLGFDGSLTSDATALVAIRPADRTAFVLGLWEKPDGDAGLNWRVDTEAVSDRVAEAFAMYDVKGFYADVAYWESYVAEWEREYGDKLTVKSPRGKGPIGWDQRGNTKSITNAHERLMSAISEGKLHHDGSRDLRRHVLNTRRRVNSHGWTFSKESKDSPNKVDAYSALLMAFECLYDYDTGNKPDQKRQRTGNAWFIG